MSKLKSNALVSLPTQVSEGKILQNMVNRYLSAIQEHNYLMIHGNSLQWQMALVRVKVIQEIITENWGLIKANGAIVGSGLNPTPIFGYITVEIAGRVYNVPRDVSTPKIVV